MAETRSIGIVGTGGRGLSHLEHLYEVRDRQFVDTWEEPWPEHSTDFPFGIYHEYASEVPEWAEDISHLDATVTAVCDPSTTSREHAVELCREKGDDPETFESLEEFRSTGVYDTVVVASPNHTHADIVVPLLEDGYDVFCEKPLASTLADHDRIIDAADGAEGLLYVGFNMRHTPKYARLADLVQQGRIGQLGMMSAHEVRVPFPRGHYYTQAESGGTLLEKDCHDFDMFNCIADADPVRVGAFGGQQVFDQNTDVVDHATVIVEYDNGVKGTLELCLYGPFTQPDDRRYEVRGTDGMIRSGSDADTLEVFDRDAHDTLTLEGISGEHSGADFRMWVDIMQVLAGESQPPATPTDAKKAAAVAIAAERSIREDRFFDIDANYDLQ